MNPGKNAIKLTKFLQMESFADFMALVFFMCHIHASQSFQTGS